MLLIVLICHEVAIERNDAAGVSGDALLEQRLRLLVFQSRAPLVRLTALNCLDVCIVEAVLQVLGSLAVQVRRVRYLLVHLRSCTLIDQI